MLLHLRAVLCFGDLGAVAPTVGSVPRRIVPLFVENEQSIILTLLKNDPMWARYYR